MKFSGLAPVEERKPAFGTTNRAEFRFSLCFQVLAFPYCLSWVLHAAVAVVDQPARRVMPLDESMQNRGGLVSIAAPGCGSSIASLTHRTAFGPSSPRLRARDVPE